MKNLLLLILLLTAVNAFPQHTLIHAHNDYAKPEPLFNALRYKAFAIEADVYPGDSLFVAHDKKEIDSSNTLMSLYITPVVKLFSQHNNRISNDTNYAPLLMIDIKENSAAVIPQLIKLITPYKNAFDRSVNKNAIQIVLSGERGLITDWTKWPVFIMFDGRPYETYDNTTIQRVAVISDSYMNYIKQKDSIDVKLRQTITGTHKKGKLLRIWAIPDNEEYWQKLHTMGVDIINTDKVMECSNYFNKHATAE